MNEKIDTVLSVERSMIILKYLATLEEDIGVRRLAHELGYSPAVTQKILNTLKLHHFVQQDEETGRYRLGLGSLGLSTAVLRRLDVTKVARPYLKQLSDRTRETTFLAVQDEQTVVYVDKAESNQPIRMDAEIGASRPLNCTAVGKVLLAFGETELSALVGTEAMAAPTSNSIIDPDTLAMELEKVKAQGFAIDEEEFHLGVMCIAAPIFSQEGKVIAAITSSGPNFRVQANLDQIVEITQEVATQISAALGYELLEINTFEQAISQ